MYLLFTPYTSKSDNSRSLVGSSRNQNILSGRLLATRYLWQMPHISGYQSLAGSSYYYYNLWQVFVKNRLVGSPLIFTCQFYLLWNLPVTRLGLWRLINFVRQLLYVPLEFNISFKFPFDWITFCTCSDKNVIA